jgi:hypothetical protein
MAVFFSSLLALVGLRALRPRPSACRTIADHVRGMIAFHDAARAASAQRRPRDDLV